MKIRRPSWLQCAYKILTIFILESRWENLFIGLSFAYWSYLISLTYVFCLYKKINDHSFLTSFLIVPLQVLCFPFWWFVGTSRILWGHISICRPPLSSTYSIWEDSTIRVLECRWLWGHFFIYHEKLYFCYRKHQAHVDPAERK